MADEPKSTVENSEGKSGCASANGSVSAPELRKWCFDRAMTLKADLDIVADLIYKAAEIEAYITDGKNPRGDFFSCADTAMSEVDHANIPGVSESSKRKTMVVVRKWLKEYGALD